MYADDDSPDFRKRGGNFAKVRAADLHLQEEHGQRVQQTLVDACDRTYVGAEEWYKLDGQQVEAGIMETRSIVVGCFQATSPRLVRIPDINSIDSKCE
tara:strand:- start:117135 stop:117428 length:294 start_codon:yes stop_codon:yes gene_type:complete